MKTVFAATIVSALLSSVAAQSSNPLPPGTPGMCFKQKRFHSIPALNLQIPLNIYQNGQNVDASLRYAMSKISLPPQSGNLMKDCLDTHNVFRILSGVTPLTWSFSAQAVAQNFWTLSYSWVWWKSLQRKRYVESEFPSFTYSRTYSPPLSFSHK